MTVMHTEGTESAELQSEKTDRRVLRADSPAYGGFTVSRDGKIVFIRGAIPGETVAVSVTERKKDYEVASVTEIIESSPVRREPPCPYFGECGGCQLQFMDYPAQVLLKEEILRETMKRNASLKTELSPSIAGPEFHYRQRGQFKISHEGEIGFYREGTHLVIPIRHCLIMDEQINNVLSGLNKLKLRGLREIHMISGDGVVLLLKGKASEEFSQTMLDTGAVGVAFESGDSIGRDYVTLDLNGINYTATPWGFFQSNWSLNREAVARVLQELGSLDGMKILDLYSGAGNFSLPLSVSAKEVIAVEENSYSVEDGRRNALLSGRKNCLFTHAPVEKILMERKRKQKKIFENSCFDIVILDPPRPGLTTEVIRALLELSPKRIVYCSCNPATLARDIKKLGEHYMIEKFCMVDFFPNSYHIEALAFLSARPL